MALNHEYLDLTGALVARSAIAGDPAAAVAAIPAAYAALRHLEAGDDEWTAELLTTAWEITKAVHGRESTVDELTATLDALFRQLARTVPAAVAPRPRPRREA